MDDLLCCSCWGFWSEENKAFTLPGIKSALGEADGGQMNT